MSCERNQNACASAASTGGGIARLTNKTANFVGAVTGVNFVVGRIKAARETARRRRLETARRKAEWIKNPERQKAAADLQAKYIGAQIARATLVDMLGAEPERLAGNTWQLSSTYGQVIFDDLGQEEVAIQAIAPTLGQEITLRNGLAAYVRPPSKKETPHLAGEAPGETGSGVLDKALGQVKGAGRWLDENKETVGAMAYKYTVPVALALAAGHDTAWLGWRPVDLRPATRTAQVATGAVVAVGMYQDIQKIRTQQAEAREWVAAIKHPQRQQAARELQQKYVGRRLVVENVKGLMGRTGHLSGNTFYASGPLGRIYFDKPGEHEGGEKGQVTIRAIMPRLGHEVPLRNGLAAVVEKQR